MMNNKQRIKMLSIYLDIIKGLIWTHSLASLPKVVFVSFVIINREYTLGKTGGEENSLTERFFAGFNSYFMLKKHELNFAFEAIDILAASNYVSVNNNQIYTKNLIDAKSNNKIMNSKAFEKWLSELNGMSDDSFIKEILKNV